jgi:hypothetical protein
VTKVGRTDAPGAVAKAVFASLTRRRPGSRAFAAAGEAARSTPADAGNPSHIPQQKSAGKSGRPRTTQ